jgi:hypothetical protein
MPLDPDGAKDRLFALSSQIVNEGVSLVPRVVPAGALFTQYTHYPNGDAIAPDNKSRWFYHAHRPEEREEGEHGHFHMFLPLDIFTGIEPVKSPPPKLPNGNKTQGVVHFAALSFGLDGMPLSWFTVNQWVTFEYLMPAEAIIARLPQFDMTDAPGDPLVNQWLTAAVHAFLDPLAILLRERDAVLMPKFAEEGDAAFAVGKYEIPSRLAFDL